MLILHTTQFASPALLIDGGYPLCVTDKGGAEYGEPEPDRIHSRIFPSCSGSYVYELLATATGTFPVNLSLIFMHADHDYK